MSFICKLFRPGSNAPLSSKEVRSSDENLVATAAQGNGFYTTEPGALLKGGRYVNSVKVVIQARSLLKICTHRISLRRKYLAAKILSADTTNALKKGLIRELEILLKVAERPPGTPEPLLPILRDHFAQKGPYSLHYCLLTRPLRTDVHAFRTSSPTGKLGIHIVKPIIACAVKALKVLHSHNIIHADIKANNLPFLGPGPAEIEETITDEPPLIDGAITLDGTEYPILLPQPFWPKIRWNATPFVAETILVVLNDLGAALWADRPKPPGDIGAFALRAPENIIRAECGKGIDIWAIGCLTYELLTGQTLFRPQAIPDLTLDESLLLLQFAVTGETLSKNVIDQSCVRDKFFHRESFLAQARANVYSDQSIKKRLTEQCNGDLTETQINAAAQFINGCLRLNPHDRLTVGQVAGHRWLSTAFMGGSDDERQPSGDPRIPPLPMSSTAPLRDVMAAGYPPSIPNQTHDPFTLSTLMGGSDDERQPSGGSRIPPLPMTSTAPLRDVMAAGHLGPSIPNQTHGPFTTSMGDIGDKKQPANGS